MCMYMFVFKLFPYEVLLPPGGIVWEQNKTTTHGDARACVCVCGFYYRSVIKYTLMMCHQMIMDRILGESCKHANAHTHIHKSCSL